MLSRYSNISKFYCANFRVARVSLEICSYPIIIFTMLLLGENLINKINNPKTIEKLTVC